MDTISHNSNQLRNNFFVDTSLLISGLVEDDRLHHAASEFFKIIKQNNGYIVVNSVVLFEMINSLQRQSGDLNPIKETFEKFVSNENVKVLAISDVQMFGILSQLAETGVKLKSSDFYISATAIFYDTYYLALDRQIYAEISKVYEKVFNDPAQLSLYLHRKSV